jgi:DNA repair protein RecO (recombination protein O)
MQDSDKAIVLGSIAIKENANVVKVFTQNNGVLSLYLSPTAKKRAARNAVLQPLSLCEIIFTSNKKSTLYNLKEAKITTPLFGVQGNIFKNTIALFVADVLSKVVPEETDENLFEFLHNAILLFDELEEGIANFHIAFLLRLTKWLGFFPHFQEEAFTNFDLREGIFMKGRPNHPHYLNFEETQIIARFLKTTWEELNTIKIKGKERRILLAAIINYYTLHIPNFREPKSLSILEEVFS